MELASTLRQLESDVQSSSMSERDLLTRFEDVRKQLQSRTSPALCPEAFALGVCYVTSQVLGLVCQHRPVSIQNASRHWHRRVFLLETAVTSAWASLTTIEDAQVALQPKDTNDVCSMYSKLWRQLLQSPSPHEARTAGPILTKLGLLLALAWLSYDRNGKLATIKKVLFSCTEGCLAHKATEKLVLWPQFLLGMIHMVEDQDGGAALHCFQTGMENCRDLVDGMGPFCYWHAIGLIHTGRFDDAVAVLDQCLRINYEPVACLSLQALVKVHAQELYAADEHLQRALEMDPTQPSALFDYALLMERMENAEAQQQVLEWIVEPCTTSKSEEKKPVPSSSVHTLFEDVRLRSCFPSRVETVDLSMVHYHLALAAVENGDWFASKKHFEHVLGPGQLHQSQRTILQAAADYVYVLLQCDLPSLALQQCEQFLLQCEENTGRNPKTVDMVLLLLHFYKADALLCLERVDECYKYLKEVAEPKLLCLREQQRPDPDAIAEEIGACHSQLLNNLAVVLACCSDIDAGLSLLRDGLETYPDCLAIKFNLVLLLWRKGDKTTACSIWTKARGWNRQAKSGAETPAYLNSAVAARHCEAPFISKHVQGELNGQGGVSAHQLLYLDALIAKCQWKTVTSKLDECSVQYVEFFESLGTTSISRQD
ncbi:hypothetical protein PsorP6_014270 [Peronosclerospora sorghi]|uniref:Uncharacterized protein n=1 Tax=Peronosclerospora sorghi TaxID=230839 RepID=A0ACC0VI44_9STRA|nr:hypothetical protein PsorP6_014270 [Peronosclerospora sorghi]